MVIDDQALAFPMALSKVPAGSYWAVAVMDFNRGEQSFSAASGNGYSKPIRVQVGPAAARPIDLRIDQVIPQRKYLESASVKLVDMESQLLSQFHDRSTHLRAAVILPASFERSGQKRYPVIYDIPGFGGNHLIAQGFDRCGIAQLFYSLLFHNHARAPAAGEHFREDIFALFAADFSALDQSHQLIERFRRHRTIVDRFARSAERAL